MDNIEKLANFKNRFLEFSDLEDTIITRYMDIVGIFLSDEEGPFLKANAHQLAHELLLAHCLTLYKNQNNTILPQIVTQSSIDKVSMQFCPPQFHNGFEYYANLTSYGQQLLALFKTQSAGGYYFGKSLERQAFRKAGGKF